MAYEQATYSIAHSTPLTPACLHGRLSGMITRETVLVLGAGASMPYGFPSGQDLVALISMYQCSDLEKYRFK